MFPGTSLLIWSQLLLMMYALEITLKCFIPNFCLTVRKMLPIILPVDITLWGKRSWIKLMIVYENLLIIRRMYKDFLSTMQLAAVPVLVWVLLFWKELLWITGRSPRLGLKSIRHQRFLHVLLSHIMQCLPLIGSWITQRYLLFLTMRPFIIFARSSWMLIDPVMPT